MSTYSTSLKNIREEENKLSSSSLVPIKFRAGSSWKSIKDIKVRKNNQWISAKAVRIYKNGVWTSVEEQ